MSKQLSTGPFSPVSAGIWPPHSACSIAPDDARDSTANRQSIRPGARLLIWRIRVKHVSELDPLRL